MQTPSHFVQTPAGLRAWIQCIHFLFHQLGFHFSKVDIFLFLKFEGSHSLYNFIYMDDILVTKSSSTQVQHFIMQLQALFALKDLGTVPYFLRLELTFTFQGVLLSQQKYITKTLHKAYMDQVKPTPTPMVKRVYLLAYVGDPFIVLYLYPFIHKCHVKFH